MGRHSGLVVCVMALAWGCGRIGYTYLDETSPPTGDGGLDGTSDGAFDGSSDGASDGSADGTTDGNTCPPSCDEGQACTANADCATGFCYNATCAEAACVEASRISFKEVGAYASSHQCGIRNDGTLWCWGSHTYGQLGIGAPTGSGHDKGSPTQVGTETTWKAIAGLADSHTCAVKDDGSMWCWGRNNQHQLGLGETGGPQEVQPVQVGTDLDWDKVTTCGSPCSCALRTDQSLWCWGALLVFAAPLAEDPAPISSPAVQWRSVAGGDLHVCGIDTTNVLWCVGKNIYGQLGTGAFSIEETAPVVVTGGHSWRKVAAGVNFTCALELDSTLWCWGSNVQGQLGQGTMGYGINSPVQVGTAAWLDISLGATHACGVRSDATLWCWGSNNSGELGQGSISPAVLQPAQVGSDAWWKSVHVGSAFSCARREDDSLWCWGDNQHGQLGGGTVGGTQSLPESVCR